MILSLLRAAAYRDLVDLVRGPLTPPTWKTNDHLISTLEAAALWRIACLPGLDASVVASEEIPVPFVLVWDEATGRGTGRISGVPGLLLSLVATKLTRPIMGILRADP